MNFLLNKNDCKMFEKNNTGVAPTVFFIPNYGKEIKQVYISKHYSEPPNQIILLLIIHTEKWHYFVVKCLLKLLTGITSKIYSGYHFTNYLN